MSKSDHRSLQEVGALLTAIEQHHVEVGAGVGDHQTGKSTTAAKIEHAGGGGEIVDRRHKIDRMLDRLIDRPLPEKAETLRRAQRFEQSGFMTGPRPA